MTVGRLTGTEPGLRALRGRWPARVASVRQMVVAGTLAIVAVTAVATGALVMLRSNQIEEERQSLGHLADVLAGSAD